MSLVGIAALELQNRVHQFNSGRGLHLLYQLVRLNFGSAIEDEKYIDGTPHGPRRQLAARSAHASSVVAGRSRYPLSGRDLRRPRSAYRARAADGIKRDATKVAFDFHQTTIAAVEHCPIVGDGCAGPPKASMRICLR